MAQTPRGLTLAELLRMFPDDETARKWLEHERWGDTPYCQHCGSEHVKPSPRRSMQWRCQEDGCRRHFNVRMNTAMEGTKLGYQTWAVALYLLTTSPKGVSATKLRDDLGINLRSAWFLAHRIRTALETHHRRGNGDGGYTAAPMAGPVEVDEMYAGGVEKWKHADKKQHLGRGTVGKTPIVGALDRATNTVRLGIAKDTTKATLAGFALRHAGPDAAIYTDEAAVYEDLPNHASVNHGRGEYVDGDCHVNGMESFWAAFRRGYRGTYHKMSVKHLHRYMDEFAGRHNLRHAGTTLERMAMLVRGMEGKRLRYRELTASNGLPSGARS